MTPFEALHTLRRHDASMKVTLPLCSTCAAALLAELDGLFPRRIPEHRCTLVGSEVLGYTFEVREDFPQLCVLHPLLREDAACR